MTPSARSLLLLIPLALLPMWMRGGNAYEALATLFVAGGAALLWTHRHLRFRKIDVILSGVLIAWCSLSAWGPEAWGPGAGWRVALPEARQAYLPWTRSPQPWISLESMLLLTGACVWWGVARGLPDGRGLRLPLYVWMLLGITATAVVALVDHLGAWDFAYWESNMGMGPFPNRNQFGCILAIGVTLAGGLFFHDLRRNKMRALLWALLGITLLAAVAVNGSRAGIVLSFTGLFGLAAGEFMMHRRLDRTGVALAVGLVVLAAAVFFGGTAWERLFPADGETGSGLDRTAIQSDAVEMVGEVPWLGTGLGQFAQLFPLHHDQFVPDKRVVHPESDWLWLGTEAGVVAWVILLVWIGICIRDFLPLSKTQDRRLRWVAAVAGLVLFVHSWVDVSAHRPGTAWPVLLLFAMSTRNRVSARSTPMPRLALAAGLLFSIAGILMWLNFTGVVKLPGSLDEQRALAAAREAVAQRRITSGEMDEHLRRAPLSPNLHYLDGVAHLTVLDDPARAADALRTAAVLSPGYMDLKRAMAQLWLSRDLRRAVEGWRDTLDSARAMRAHQATLIVQENPDPLARELLWSLVPEFPELILPLASAATPAELDRHAALVARADPPRRPGSVESILEIWARAGDPPALLEAIGEREGWKEHAWVLRVRVLADKGDYQAAALLLKKNVGFSARQLQPLTREQAQAAQQRLLRNPKDKILRLQLASTYYQQGQPRSAEEKLRPLIEARENLPAYAYWIMAEAALDNRQWQEAHQFLVRFRKVSAQESRSP